MTGPRVEAEVVAEISWPNIRFNIKVAKLQTFDRTASNVLKFLTSCNLFIRMRIKDIVVEEQIQWVLLYMEINRYLKEKCSGGFEDRKLKIRDSWEIFSRSEEGVWKRRWGDNKDSIVKEDWARNGIMEEFIQEFRRAARGSRYEERLLVEEFKREMNVVIIRKLTEIE